MSDLYRYVPPGIRMVADALDVNRLIKAKVLVPVEPDLEAMVDVLNGLTAEDLPHVEWHRGAANLLWEAAIGR